jgi:anti-sigma factor RsiW
MQHLDEGMIHAWLDGQLPRDEAAAVEAHVAECRPCADAVAEARGLIAASSRILTALDAVPREVAPKPIAAPDTALPEGVLSLRREAPPNVEAVPPQAPVSPVVPRRPRRWFTAPTLAAAAAVVAAVGMFSLYRQDRAPEATASFDAARATADSSGVAAPSAAVATVPPQSLGAGAAANEARQQSAPPASPQNARLEADRPTEARTRAAFEDSAAVASDERRKVENQATADASKQKELARSVPAAKLADAAAGGIRGRVTDANKTGIVGAMVQVAGTNTAITTNPQGEYSLGGVQPGGQQLVINRAGYQSANLNVSVVQGQTVSADVVLTPAPTAFSPMEAPRAASGVPNRASGRARDQSAPAPTPSRPPSVLQSQSSAAGCYEWTVTATTAQQRTRFLQIPRRLALDSVVTPSSNDGIWYRARDLARTAVLPNGLWRPVESGVEVQWVVGSKTSTVRLTGEMNGVTRGTIEEIDRSAGTGESGNVISMRRPCEG